MKTNTTIASAIRDLGTLGLLLALSGLVACSNQPKPRHGDEAATLPAASPAAAIPPDTAPPVAPTPPPRQPPGPASGDTAATGASAPSKKDDSVIVIDRQTAPQPTTLVEAAQRARQEREQAPRAKIVITDDNLAEYATGQLTVAAPEKTDGGAQSPAASTADPGRDEQHWREGSRELRLKLRRAWDEARELEKQVAGLRVRFYAEDDPYVRDSQIKPAWDRALERQRQAEQEVKAYRRELDEFLDQGRRAGALPGWLREGIEYEPEPPSAEAESAEKSEKEIGRHVPVEPEPMEKPSRPPR